jgi:hypothetical protein
MVGLDALLSQINVKTLGAPGYPPLIQLKIVLLRQWYNLSDPRPKSPCVIAPRSAASTGTRSTPRR